MLSKRAVYQPAASQRRITLRLHFHERLRTYTARAAVAAVYAAVLASQATASSIAISDPSFESPVVTTFGSLSGTGWTSTGGTPIVDRPGTNQFNSIPDGSQVAILDDFNSTGTLSQTLTTNLAANTLYTLTFFVGNDILIPSDGYTAALTAGGVTLASDNSAVSPTAGNFLQDTITFSSGATPAQLGQALGITFSDVGFQAVAFDNVQLDGTLQVGPSAPEPATWILVALGAILAVSVKRLAGRRSVQQPDSAL
jgi:hypothetical protein